MSGGVPLVGWVAVLAGFASVSVAQGGPVTAMESISISPVHFAATTETSSAIDDCVYAETRGQQGATANGVGYPDLRWVACEDYDPFTLVSGSDDVEQSRKTVEPTIYLKYSDLNGNARYDGNDDVLFLTTKSGSGLDATGSSSRFSVRLMASGGQPAGTFVMVAHSDYGSFQTPLDASLAWEDRDGDIEFGSSDILYILVGIRPGYGAGRPIPDDAFVAYPHNGLFPGQTASPGPTASSSHPTTTASQSPSNEKPASTDGPVAFVGPPAFEGKTTEDGSWAFVAALGAVGGALAAIGLFRRR